MCTEEGCSTGTYREHRLVILTLLHLILFSSVSSCSRFPAARFGFGTHTPEWILIPAGSFIMGAEEGDDDEEPVHNVLLNPYWITSTEITNDQYHACVKAGDCRSSLDSDFSTSNEPVVYVSWFEAQDYCAWVGGRLPTEAEWEKAGRGGLVGARYPWGNSEVSCDTTAPNGAQFGYCAGGLRPVGSFAQNAFGLFDMAGNAWEWVSDWYDEDYYQYSPVEDPSGPKDGKYKVIRGGGWNYTVYGLRVAYRSVSFPDSQTNFIGFRCARDNSQE